MTTFSTAALPDVAPPDPTKHVRYTLGMVLGVDDFTQESAYVLGRTKRVVADLLGYGVSFGLRVTVGADPDKGPRVNVAPGEAVTPSGQLVCVTPAQCAFVNEWLRANRAEVERMMSPPAGPLPLYVVACYRECATDDVPIPGEPCRSEDELMAPSRTQDDFALELSLKQPPPGEQETERAFARWLAQIPVVNTPGAGPEAFLGDLRAVLQMTTGSPPSSPPSSPPTPTAFLATPPPPGLEIPGSDAAAYFDAAFRFWATDLRPLARGGIHGGECGCGGTMGPNKDVDCVLLAELTVPIVVDAVSGELVADTAPIAIDELSRPTLASLSFLQELVLAQETTP
jgi:hypothetical protein